MTAFQERGLQLHPSVSEHGALGGTEGTGHYHRETRGFQDRLKLEVKGNSSLTASHQKLNRNRP